MTGLFYLTGNRQFNVANFINNKTETIKNRIQKFKNTKKNKEK